MSASNSKEMTPAGARAMAKGKYFYFQQKLISHVVFRDCATRAEENKSLCIFLEKFDSRPRPNGFFEGDMNKFQLLVKKKYRELPRNVKHWFRDNCEAALAVKSGTATEEERKLVDDEAADDPEDVASASSGGADSSKKAKVARAAWIDQLMDGTGH